MAPDTSLQPTAQGLIDPIAAPTKNFVAIMKDGKIFTLIPA